MTNAYLTAEIIASAVVPALGGDRAFRVGRAEPATTALPAMRVH